MDVVGARAGRVIPALFTGVCADAALFPPGRASLPDAVRAHADRAAVWYAELVGPLVLPASALGGLGELLAADALLPLTVTFPDGPAAVPATLAAVERLPVALRAVEVTLPDGLPVDALAQLDEVRGPDVYVEVPRDGRRAAVLDGLRGRHRAKFRTGGVRADLHPDEAELAAAVVAAVRGGVAFKATAGLHRAVRNTDPDTGFEQHGFLNLLLAADAAASGASEDETRALLAERDPDAVAARVRGLDATRARAAFVSFGTCSITDPLTDLVALGLLTEQVSP